MSVILLLTIISIMPRSMVGDVIFCYLCMTIIFYLYLLIQDWTWNWINCGSWSGKNTILWAMYRTQNVIFLWLFMTLCNIRRLKIDRDMSIKAKKMRMMMTTMMIIIDVRVEEEMRSSATPGWCCQDDASHQGGYVEVTRQGSLLQVPSSCRMGDHYNDRFPRHQGT